MPGGDKTGPRGEGAMTGRGMGFCSGNEIPGYSNPGFNSRARGGFGFGQGIGRGNRRGFPGSGQAGWAGGRGRGNPTYSSESHIDFPTTNNRAEEVRYLANEAKRLKQMLDEINSKIDRLSKENDK